MLPKRVSSKSPTRNHLKGPARSESFHTDYSKPIPVGGIINNNRFIYAPSSNKQQGQRVGAYFWLTTPRPWNGSVTWLHKIIHYFNVNKNIFQEHVVIVFINL